MSRSFVLAFLTVAILVTIAVLRFAPHTAAVEPRPFPCPVTELRFVGEPNECPFPPVTPEQDVEPPLPAAPTLPDTAMH